jgi:methyl-accepting chemotaxis protein
MMRELVEQRGTPMDVNKLLDDMEEFVERRWLPFRKALFIDADDLLDFTHQIRAALPGQIQKADQITREKDRILAEAREQADRMVSEAAEQAELTIRRTQEEARGMVAASEITRLATIEGARIVDQARKDADSMRSGAQEYARNVFDHLIQAVDTLGERAGQIRKIAEDAREEIKG